MIRIDTNNSHKNTEQVPTLIYPDLSYTLTGIFFYTHNTLGRYAREKQYGDLIAKKLIELKISFQRELMVGESGNRIDFLIDGKIVVELKAQRIITREDYYQLQRYLQESDIRLGLLVNFRSQYIKPMRIVKIETDNKAKFL